MDLIRPFDSACCTAEFCCHKFNEVAMRKRIYVSVDKDFKIAAEGVIKMNHYKAIRGEKVVPMIKRLGEGTTEPEAVIDDSSPISFV